jgi:hypothetical protein
MSTTKTVVKLWSGANPGKLEAWLEGMELEGWQLVKVHWGGVQFHFQKGTPSKVSYCLDYKMKSEDQYIGIIEEAGWELMFNTSGWLIWRKPYGEHKPEIYTDIESLVARNQRLIRLYGFLLLTQLPIITLHRDNMMMLFILVPLYGILAFVLIQLLLSNRKLKAKDGH